MELKLNKMNKVLFRDRAKKLMLTGALAGVIAGVVITSGISSITLKKAEKKLEISNAKLQEQTKKNEELQAELDREEVTENTAELLASDDDRGNAAEVEIIFQNICICIVLSMEVKSCHLLWFINIFKIITHRIQIKIHEFPCSLTEFFSTT